MKLTTALAAIVLAFAPSFAFAQGCSGSHSKTAQISCAEGTMFDAETGTCMPLTT